MLTQVNTLPTGKKHVSFSELSEWLRCSHRHYLHHVQKIGTDQLSVPLAYGSAQHSSIELAMSSELGTTGAVDQTNAEMERIWGEHVEFEDNMPLEQAQRANSEITRSFTGFLDEKLPGWKLLHNEYKLMVPVEDTGYLFKGFIDLVLEHRGRVIIVDMKTCNKPWSVYKKLDNIVRAQLVLYRRFYAQDTGTSEAMIDLAFATLDKTAMKCDELISVIPSEEETLHVRKRLDVFYKSISSGIHVKNRSECMWCPYKATVYCERIRIC